MDFQQGESPAYVPRQLGHASIQLPVDTYGRWLPMGNTAAVDRLDDATPGGSGSKVVANAVFGGTGASEPAELAGAGGGSRTRDLLITNPAPEPTQQDQGNPTERTDEPPA